MPRLSFLLALPVLAASGCAALMTPLPPAEAEFAPQIIVVARTEHPAALRTYSLAHVHRSSIDAAEWGRDVARELRAARYAGIVEYVGRGDLDEAGGRVFDIPGTWTAVLELDHVEFVERPGALFWPNTALWFVSWIPSAVVPDRRFLGRAEVLLTLYEDDDVVDRRRLVVRHGEDLSPAQYGQPWLGLIRFQVDRAWRVHRAALDADDWRIVTHYFDPLMVRDLSRQVAEVLRRHYRQALDRDALAVAPAAAAASGP